MNERKLLVNLLESLRAGEKIKVKFNDGYVETLVRKVSLVIANEIFTDLFHLQDDETYCYTVSSLIESCETIEVVSLNKGITEVKE